MQECRENADTHADVIPAQAGIQYSEMSVIEAIGRGLLDTPLSRGMTANYHSNCTAVVLAPQSSTATRSPFDGW